MNRKGETGPIDPQGSATFANGVTVGAAGESQLEITLQGNASPPYAIGASAALTAGLALGAPFKSAANKVKVPVVNGSAAPITQVGDVVITAVGLG
jgi:hypothetical protein